MTTETDLLPLPDPKGNQIVMRGDDFQCDYNFYVSAFTGDQLEAYARANVAHATAPLQAEIEELRAEVERANSWNERVSVCRDHVADIVDGPCVICALDAAEARADKLEEALRAERRRWVDRKTDAIQEQVGGLTRGDPEAIARCDAAIQRIDAAIDRARGKAGQEVGK